MTVAQRFVDFVLKSHRLRKRFHLMPAQVQPLRRLVKLVDFRWLPFDFLDLDHLVGVLIVARLILVLSGRPLVGPIEFLDVTEFF